MDLNNLLQDYQNTKELLYFTLECRLGNPPEILGFSKYGTVSELTVNHEKPKQSYFYLNYPQAKPSGAARFKAHLHEVKMLVDNSGNIVYIDQQ